MAFGLDDLANWVRNLVDNGANAINVVNGDAPLTNIQSVNQNVQKGIIDPGKMLSEFSGLAQGYRGARPNSSTMDKGLALLALTGMLSGGAADDIAMAGKKVPANKLASGVKNKFLDVFGPKVEMLHASPTSGISRLNPSRNAESILGAQPNAYSYWLPKEQAIGNLPQYLAPGRRMPLNGKVTGSIYSAKIPKHRLEPYPVGSGNIMHAYGRRTSIPVRVSQEKRFADKGLSDVNDTLRQWLKIND